MISFWQRASRFEQRAVSMSDLFWLTDAQTARPEPYFPKSHGKPHVDGRRVLSGIIAIIRNGLRWRDAPAEYGPHQTLYIRWKRGSVKGVFAQMKAGLAGGHGEEKTVIIDATYLKAHRTATRMGVKKKGGRSPDCPDQGWHEHEAARDLRQLWPTTQLVRHCRAASQRCKHRLPGSGSATI